MSKPTILGQANHIVSQRVPTCFFLLSVVAGLADYRPGYDERSRANYEYVRDLSGEAKDEAAQGSAQYEISIYLSPKYECQD